MSNYLDDRPKDFLFQTFALFPLSAAATFGLVMFIGPLCHVENAGDSWLVDGVEIVFIILFFTLFIVCTCIYLHLRGFKAGSKWWWFGFALSPIRPLFQFVACILALIFMKSTKYEPEYYFQKKDTKKDTALLFFFNLVVYKKFVPQYKTKEMETQEENKTIDKK